MRCYINKITARSDLFMCNTKIRLLPRNLNVDPLLSAARQRSLESGAWLLIDVSTARRACRTA